MRTLTDPLKSSDDCTASLSLTHTHTVKIDFSNRLIINTGVKVVYGERQTLLIQKEKFRCKMTNIKIHKKNYGGVLHLLEEKKSTLFF